MSQVAVATGPLDRPYQSHLVHQADQPDPLAPYAPYAP